MVTSARAMDEPIMKDLSDYNQGFPEQGYSRKKRNDPDLTQWAGRNIRIMLWLLYILAFLCLLRYDEALHIRWSDLILTQMRDGLYRLEVRLPFRKTHQTGGTSLQC